MRLHVLQHVAFEGPAAIAWWARSRAHELRVHPLYEGAPLPSVGEDEGLIALGGPMGVGDEERHPWMAGEIALLERILAAQRPVLGICLGAQLLARALGAPVRPLRAREIGWHEVALTTAGERSPLTAGLPSRFAAFHWHGDQFEPPEGAEHLASSAACRHQAFAHGRALALQFHLESTPPAIEALIEHGADELTAGGTWVQDRTAIREGAARCGEANALLEEVLDALFGG